MRYLIIAAVLAVLSGCSEKPGLKYIGKGGSSGVDYYGMQVESSGDVGTLALYAAPDMQHPVALISVDCVRQQVIGARKVQWQSLNELRVKVFACEGMLDKAN